MFDQCLDILLELNGTEYTESNGFWYRIEAWRVEPSQERPHGIRYNLTLHDEYNNRVMGFDNAHGVRNKKKGFHGRIVTYDHSHDTPTDKGTSYFFISAEQLLSDFFGRVNEIMIEIESKE